MSKTSTTVNYETTLREEIFKYFLHKTFSPVDLAELVNRDVRSIRTSLQRFTKANFTIRNKRGEYLLNTSHPQAVKLIQNSSQENVQQWENVNLMLDPTTAVQ